MADWTNLPNQAVGVGGLPSGTTVTALRDNPVAIAEGAAGAPRLFLRALEQLEAGDQIRSRNDETISYSDEPNTRALHAFDFIQTGIVRASIERLSGNSDSFVEVRRIRNGVATQLASRTSNGTLTVDVSVLPGDRVELNAVRVLSFGDGDISARRGRFSTNGQDLWPGSSQRLEGNRAAT